MMFLRNIFRLVVVISLLSQVINAAVVPTVGSAPVAASVCVGGASVVPASHCYDGVCKQQVFESQEERIESKVAALAKDYGYKTANLMVLKELTQDSELVNQLSKFGFSISVPEFVGISDQTMKGFLREAGLDLDARWRDVLENSNMNNPAVARIALQSKTLPKEFVAELQKLSTEIGNTFESLAKQIEQKEQAGWFVRLINLCLGSSRVLFSAEIEDFLALAQKNKWHLMVRSTGREDTKECANAGGNKSIANVEPNRAGLLRAIGQVLQSYIIDTETNQPKSLMQRLQCSNGADILDNFFGSILIQVMIGESLGSTQIPVGCVVYTQESEGKTPDITSLQCSFGHAEGVVESSVGIDSCYVDGLGDSHCIIKFKPSRLVPDCDGSDCKLTRVANPEDLQNKPVLSQNASKALKIVAANIQKIYEQPMDLELVVDQDTIHLVQARPIQDNPLNPQYLTSIDLINPEDIVYGSTVCSADGAVRLINEAKEIITAQTLDEALNIFNKPENMDREFVKVVIVAGAAESTSHAAAVFRGANIAIFIANDLQRIESWKTQNFKLILDVQREVVVRTASQPVSMGWFTHPLPNKVMIDQNTNLMSSVEPENLLPEVSIKDLIEMLKEANQIEAKKALATILFKFNDQIKRKEELAECIDCCEKKPAAQALRLLKRLQAYIYKVSNKINEHLNLPARDIKRLFYINWLEAALQQKESKNIIDSYSLDSVIQNHDGMVKFVEEKIKPLVESGVVSSQIYQNMNALKFARSGAAVAFVSELETNWIKFVDVVYKHNSEIISQFEALIKEIEGFEIMPAWINFVFAPAFKKTGDVALIFNELNEAFIQSKEAFSFIKTQRQILDNYDIAKWQKPELFGSQLKSLQDLIAVFTSEKFMNMLSGNFLEKLATLQVMDKFVDLFDQSIKQLKGSRFYAEDKIELVTNFKTMLQQYFNLMKVWVKKLSEGSLKFCNELSLDEYLKKIQKILINLPIAIKQLDASPGFSVTNAALGSCTAFSRFLLQSMEDVFTLVHQDLLITIGTFTKNFIPDFSKPDLFIQVESNLLSLTHRKEKAWLIGVSVSSDKLVARYNLPLNNHSVVFELGYYIESKETFLSIRFVGDGPDHNDRWNLIKFFAELAEDFDFITIKDIKVNDSEAIINIAISSKTKMSLLASSINGMVDIANAEDIGPVVDYLLKDKNDVNNFLRIITQKKLYNVGVFDIIGDLVVLDKGFKADFEPFINSATDFVSLQPQAPQLEMLVSLVKNNFVVAYNPAFKAAVSAVVNDNHNVRLSGLKLFKLLVRGKFIVAYEAASNEAYAAVQSDDAEIRYAGQNLFEALFNVGYGFESGFNAASSAVTSSNYLIREIGLNLLKLLVEKNYISAYKFASEAAVSAVMNDNDYIVKDSGLALFKLLVEKNYISAYKFASEAAVSAVMNGNNYVVKNSGLELFKILVEKNYIPVYESASRAVAYAVTSGYISIVENGLDLFKELVKKKHEPVVVWAIKNIGSGKLIESVENDLKKTLKEHCAYFGFIGACPGMPWIFE